MLMRKELLVALATAAALGCGLMGGIFFAFSNFVMRALATQPADQGIRAMQAINLQIVNPLFLVLFVGTPLDPASFQAQQFWIRYLSEWVTWNHVRTISAAAASVTLITAIWQISERAT